MFDRIKEIMSQLLFVHKNYDPFHLYIELIKYLFQSHVIFLSENFFYVFIKNLLSINHSLLCRCNCLTLTHSRTLFKNFKNFAFKNFATKKF